MADLIIDGALTTILNDNHSGLTNAHGIEVHETFKTDMVENLYAENTHKLNEFTEDKFLRTDDDRLLVSTLTAKANTGSIIFEKASGLKLGDFMLVMEDGTLTLSKEV
jgi:hypothetical protein